MDLLDLLDLLECAEFSESFSQPAFALKASWKLDSVFQNLGLAHNLNSSWAGSACSAVHSDGMAFNPLWHKAGLLHRPGKLLVCVKERGEYDMREGIGN